MQSHSDIRIVILGKTGTGKSETGNSILGRQEFECSPGGDITTWKSLKKEGIRFQKNILVIDTPGLQDNKTPSHATRSEIQDAIQMAYPVSRTGNAGPNVFLLCLKMGRVTVEDETVFKECLICFGEEMYRFTIIVFTHLDIWKANMEHSGKPPNDGVYIKSLPHFAKEFIGKCNGKIFFNNRKTGLDMDLQVKSLFQKIDEMMDINSGNIYTEEILNQAVLREKLKQHEQNSFRGKMQNYMNYINRPYIINSVLAIGNVFLFWGSLRR